jgi:rubrerythrin
MTRIDKEPPASIHSLDDLLVIAHAMETDAAARYVETARLLRQRGSSTLADLFEQLAVVETGHVFQVEEWARGAHRASPAGRPTPWPIPDTFDQTPEEAGGSSILTPYRALSAAVRHEERSFTFWSYVAAQAERSDVRLAAEKMAHEELEHVAILRRERRKAFHQERDSGSPDAISLGQVAALEEQLADLLEAAPPSLAWPAGIGTMAADARLMARHLRDLGSDDVLRGPMPALKDDALALAEFLVEAYLRMADESREEDVLTLAQTNAAAAVQRLAVLGGDTSTRRPPAP